MLTTKEKPMDRADDPDLAEKMKAEAEGIFLWAFEGLQRLVANNFKFTESDRKALILIRGKNVLEVDKYDYSKHPEAKKLRPSKAASHVPAWRANQPQEKQTPSAPPSQAAEKKPAQKKKPAPAEKVVAVTKESIMKKKEDT